jgi:ribosomal peptide maturation radical SAM protein 1
MSSADVVLINMPFAPLLAPSLGLSLLKSILNKEEVSATILYFSVSYAELTGEHLYNCVSQDSPPQDLVGEWIFADSLFGRRPDSQANKFVDEILPGWLADPLGNNSFSGNQIDQFTKACDNASEFLDVCLEEVIKRRPKIVGFTSVFQQHVASLSLAKRLKAADPSLFIVFGGANCEGVMGRETVRCFPFVDAAVSGEGEEVFPELVRRVLGQQPIEGLQGVLTRGDAILPVYGRPVPHTAVIHDLDNLPIPDYADYFERLDASPLALSERAHLPFETSRGCWWGDKQHCTFCGLNGETMAYRSKSSGRAFDEFSYLIGKFPGRNVRVVDNILEMDYFKDFIPRLAEGRTGAQIFYEVKANLKKDQLKQLKAAGISLIQPGIESLSTSVLKIMCKGVRGLQNIQLLKWCEEFGIVPEWNFIWGFPGEPEEEYARLAELVPFLSHLPPPVVGDKIRVDRFSPNFSKADELGLKNLSPYPAYGYVYSLPPEALANLAYYFTFDYKTPQDVDSYVEALEAAISKWQQDYSGSRLFYVESGERLLIWDSRPVAPGPLVVLTGLAKFVYVACDKMMTLRKIVELCCSSPHGNTDRQAVSGILRDLQDKALLIEEDGFYLALAVRTA